MANVLHSQSGERHLFHPYANGKAIEIADFLWGHENIFCWVESPTYGI